MRGNHNKTPSPCPSWPCRRELPYQADELPTVLPVLTNELVQGLADTTILEVLDDDPVEPVYDDTNEDIDYSDDFDE